MVLIFPNFVIFDQLCENHYLRTFFFRVNLRKLIPAKKFFQTDLRRLARDYSLTFHVYKFGYCIFSNNRKCIFAKINHVKFEKSLWGVFVSLFKLFPKKAVLIQTKLLQSCFHGCLM